MANKMIIDASHPEETRVVVLRGNRVEEFDFESASKRPLRGNIYLAKVTRVEPSLQAAFIDYGGNRHGFLAFSEIHPDYYQIPVADRQALLEEEAQSQREEDEETNGERRSRRHRHPRRQVEARAEDREIVSEPAPADEFGEQHVLTTPSAAFEAAAHDPEFGITEFLQEETAALGRDEPVQELGGRICRQTSQNPRILGRQARMKLRRPLWPTNRPRERAQGATLSGTSRRLKKTYTKSQCSMAAQKSA